MSEWAFLRPAEHITGHFEEDFQAINCTGTDIQTQNKQTRENTQKKTEKAKHKTKKLDWRKKNTRQRTKNPKLQ